MRREFYIRISALVCVVSGLAVAGDIRLSGQTAAPEADRLETGAGVHETHAQPESSFQLPNTNELSSEREAVLPSAPTRSSFMATWEPVSGAKGYLLDVSTSSAFDSYVDGYHDLDVGDTTGRVVTGLNRNTTYYYRVRGYDVAGAAGYMQTMSIATESTTGLTIRPTFDSSITNNPNAAAIEAMISRAISFHESLFRDPITIQIRFRYSTTAPGGMRLPMGTVARTDFVLYRIPWGTYISALRADATTGNDNQANASLPGTALTANIRPSSACGRAVGLNTPPAMFADGTVGQGGPYDGIVTLNSAVPYQFSRPPGANSFDAQRSTEHEVDEAIGLGSRLGGNGNDLRPQDLFSWSSPGHRNISTSGTRYFSINSGATNIVKFNQDTDGDLGDWFSEPCPQTHPYVQNAFACRGQFTDIAATSPEGVNLDVIGYDLTNGSGGSGEMPTDFNNDGHPDYLLYNAATRRTVIWYMNDNVHVASNNGPTLPSGWSVVSVADFNRDGHPDYLLYNPATRATVIWYLTGARFLGANHGPQLVSGWEVVGTGDFNGNGGTDLVLYRASTHETVIWYLNNNVRVGSIRGPTIPGGWSIVAVADFNRDGHPDYLLFKPSTGQSVIWYLSGSVARIGSRSGPIIPAGYSLVGVADFDGNGSPDYVLYNPGTNQTAIWYLNNFQLIGTAFGPTLPGGWILAAP
jgi:hypothetical protein